MENIKRGKKGYDNGNGSFWKNMNDNIIFYHFTDH